MVHFPKEAEHSEKYSDDLYEYKHVTLPKELYEKIPKGKLLSENDWRKLGIAQSRGWVNYTIHKPEPHILLFRRPLGTDPKTGAAPSEISLKIAYRNKMKVNSLLDNFSQYDYINM